MLYLTFSKVSERSKAPSTLQCALSDSHTMEAMSSKDYVCVKIKPHGLKISLPDEIVIMSAGVADDSNRCVRAIRGVSSPIWQCKKYWANPERNLTYFSSSLTTLQHLLKIFQTTDKSETKILCKHSGHIHYDLVGTETLHTRSSSQLFGIDIHSFYPVPYAPYARQSLAWLHE